MSDSFVIREACRSHPDRVARTVLVTGAAGRIGSFFVTHAPERYTFRLIVHPDEDAGDIEDRGSVHPCLLEDRVELEKLCRGVDTVVHLAADASPTAPWDSVLKNNIVGTYNIFDAAESAGCRRVVFASSIHAVSGYPPGRQVQPDDPLNPGDIYGVSKCFGEALGRFMAIQRGLSTICIRIGAYQPREAAEAPAGLSMINAFVSREDLSRLIGCAIDNETLRFAIVHGLSNNTFNRMDITSAEELLGYAPQDDLTEMNAEIKDLNLHEQAAPKSESQR